MTASRSPSYLEQLDAMCWFVNDQPWIEARAIEEPRRKDCAEPRLLVERIQSDLAGPRGEQLAHFPGEPVISLFTGCGGIDIGTESAGLVPVVQHEMDPTCCHLSLVVSGGVRRAEGNTTGI